MSSALRLALVGAFRFPFIQGSQAFVAEQAQALVDAGAEVSVASYGPGPDAESAPGSKQEGRDDHAPAWQVIAIEPGRAPRSARSGPGFAKPRADLALARKLAAAHDAHPFDALLAHNVEAMATVRLARAFFGLRAPSVYVVHTLAEYEITAYVPAAASAASAWKQLGRRIDAWAACSADAVLTLCEKATLSLRPHARGPLACIPPGLLEKPKPAQAAIEAACTRLGSKRGSFVLYSGNVDAYQDLEDLVSAARALRGAERLVIATHDPRGAAPALAASPSIVVHTVCDEAEARALRFAAAAHVVPRARPGGFPIKLLNAMESGRPIVARSGVADTLANERSALLLHGDTRGGRELGSALRRLLDDPALGQRLGRAARVVLREHHAWPEAARRTLALVERVVTPRCQPSGPPLHGTEPAATRVG